MSKKISRIYYLFIWVVLIAPSVVFAVWVPGQSIVPCGTGTTGACNFDGFIRLINNLLDFFIWASAPIAMIVFAWIGWTFIVEGDKSGARSGANKRLVALLKGIFLILSAWLIVKLILSMLVRPDLLQDIPIGDLNS
ncbi:hypothetical protein KKG48_00795 [Patescibacteria group bacterium]|nr:hypothetical protein [Patescibacteria group bacterium]MCG2694652.1 hypothetical protein [Candidatus Parcubacteria bacterium]